MSEDFISASVLFYALAAYEGYKFSAIRPRLNPETKLLFRRFRRTRSRNRSAIICAVATPTDARIGLTAMVSARDFCFAVESATAYECRHSGRDDFVHQHPTLQLRSSAVHWAA